MNNKQGHQGQWIKERRGKKQEINRRHKKIEMLLTNAYGFASLLGCKSSLEGSSTVKVSPLKKPLGHIFLKSAGPHRIRLPAEHHRGLCLWLRARSNHGWPRFTDSNPATWKLGRGGRAQAGQWYCSWPSLGGAELMPGLETRVPASLFVRAAAQTSPSFSSCSASHPHSVVCLSWVTF